MGKGTIYGSTGNQYIDAKIEWSSTANNPANTSSVTAKLYYKRNNTGFQTYGTGNFSITIDGEKQSVSEVLTITESAWVLAMTAIKTVTHNNDGKKSITISATGSISGTTLTSTSCSGRVTLDTIPRAATITSAGNVTLGNACSVKWTPASTSFRYKVKFELGEWSYTTGAIHPNTTSAYTYKGYSLPLAVANQLPSEKTGTMTATLYTYSDSGATTQVGDEASKTFTVTVPNTTATKPSVTMALSPVHSLGSAFDGVYVKGKSKVKATLSGEGKYSAQVSSYRMYAMGKTYSASPYQSEYLTTAGSVTIEGRAYDSRGYYGSIKTDITVLPYSKPSLLPVSGEKTIICARCDADGNLSESGTYLKIKAKRSYSKVKDGDTQKNFCTIRYRYREESSKTFSDWKVLLSKSTTTTDTVDTKLADVVTDVQTSYVVQVGVADDVGETSALQFVIPTDFVTIDIPEKHKGRRIGVGRYAEDSDEDGIDVGLPIHGGMVDNLTLGEMITATSSAPIDLNNYKTAGNYYSPSADNSKHITNSPYSDGGFGLTVRELQSVNMIRQELFYGRTNWQRHYNGSTATWSEWLRYLMTDEASSTAVDFVTEIGVWNVDDSNTDLGYWRYRKWKSGAVDMNGLIQVFPETESTLGTAGVYYSKVIYLNLPFDVVNFNFTGSTNSYHCFIGNCNSVEGNNSQIRLRLYRFTDFAGLVDYKVYVRIVASGKLKT